MRITDLSCCPTNSYCPTQLLCLNLTSKKPDSLEPLSNLRQIGNLVPITSSIRTMVIIIEDDPN